MAVDQRGMQAVAKPLHTLLASSAFCEYGGTQTRPEYDERPVDMPPMVSVSIGGIRPCLTIV